MQSTISRSRGWRTDGAFCGSFEGGGWWAGTPGAKTVGAGPLLFGNLDNSKAVLSGWSWSLTMQGAVSGFQVIWNSSGLLAGPTLSLSVNTSNQITNSGSAYDASGDMTSDGTYTYTWDAHHRLQSAGGVTYTYDGDGKRVMNSAGTYYWTTPSGEQLSDTPGAGAGNEYIFFAGQRIAWVDSGGTVRYYFGDHLGTSRIVTDASGNVCYDADYYPFQGERTPYVNTCTPGYKMAGMKFDQESGNYHTLNRYYPANLGPWMSPDPLAANVTNPQSLNRYAYVTNNPLALTDPLGMRRRPGRRPEPRAHYASDCRNLDICVDYDGGVAGGCSLDGMAASCSTVFSLIQAGAAAVCPGNDCTGIKAEQGPGGSSVVYQWVPGGQMTLPASTICSSGACWDEPAQTIDAPAHWEQVQVSIGIVPFPPGIGPAGAAGGQASALRVIFGHGARHLAGTGVSEAEASAAITGEIQAMANQGVTFAGGFWGRVLVGMTTIEYRAWTLAQDIIKVGTYYVPRIP